MELSAGKLRKVALVVASLDAQAADRLLEQLPDESAQKVRNLLLTMSTIDLAEQRAAIREFLGRERQAAPSANTGRPISDRRVATARESRPAIGAPHHGSSHHGTSHAGPAERTESPLDRAPERLIAECLRQELPQTIAVALAELATERASEVISYLPDSLQAAVLERLVEYDPTTALEWTEMREEFQQWFNEQLEHALHRADLAARLASLLEASHPETRQRILHNMAGSDQGLVREMQQQLMDAGSPRR